MEKALQTLAWLFGGIVALVLAAGICLLGYRVVFWTWIDNYELGYMYSSTTGEITVLEHGGYIYATPFLENVHTIDLRPMQVRINANGRMLNAKLVEFNPAGVMEFLAMHGRDDYAPVDIDTCGMQRDGALNCILMSYAYLSDAAKYPFLTVLPSSSNEIDATYLPAANPAPLAPTATPVETEAQ